MEENTLTLQLTNAQQAMIAEKVGGLASVQHVDCDADAIAAQQVVADAKTLVKTVHDQRMIVSRQVDAVKKQLIAREETICADLNAGIARVSALATAYLNAKAEAEAKRQAEEQAKRQAELAAAQEQAALEAALTGNEVAVPQAIEPEQKKTPLVAGVKARCYWSFKVHDPDSVPRQFCCPDEKLIREYMETWKKLGKPIEELSIPGVQFAKDMKI